MKHIDDKYYCDYCHSELPVVWQKADKWWTELTGQTEVLVINECEKCELIIWNNNRMRVYKGTLKVVGT